MQLSSAMYFGGLWSTGAQLEEQQTWADPEGGGTGGLGSPPPPLKNHKNIGFLSNTGPDPLEITKLPSQHSMLGHHLHASKTPFKWQFAGGPMTARL